MRIDVSADGYKRRDKPVEVALEPDRPVARVVEEDSRGTTVDLAVPFQQDEDRLIFLLTGTTLPDATRRFRIVAAQEETAVQPLVSLVDGIEDEGQESYRIVTPNATWFYHKQGAGFSSLLDADGLDWLSYHPGEGSAGEYRGIPNMGHPEGYCHPGKQESRSRLLASGPLCVSILSESNDGVMRCRWDVFPGYARLTVLRMRTPYWFLYEGTPGGNPDGALDEEEGYCVLSDGTCSPLSDEWEGPLPKPEWVYFGAGNVERVLYLAHHEADDEIDSYWPMEHNMTVFGFGRLGLEKYMKRVPAQFTVGFCPDGTFEAARSAIDSAFRPLQVAIFASA
jgi:hypothetical protein